jgi:hypothetical protein
MYNIPATAATNKSNTGIGVFAFGERLFIQVLDVDRSSSNYRADNFANMVEGFVASNMRC